jgi:type VI secretion system secreted protein VgrG
VVHGNLGYKATNMTFEAKHIDFKVTGSSSMVLESPKGPYTIMANKYTLVSNTDASIIAVGNINQTSIENNVTVYGSNNGSFHGMSSDTNIGFARSTFLGLAMESTIGLGISSTAGAQLEYFAGARSSTTLSADMEMCSVKMFLPAGSTPGDNITVLTASQTSAFTLAHTLVGFSGLMTWALGIGEDGAQHSQAAQELREVAQAAANAGHPGLAARLRRLVEDGAGTMGDDAPTSTMSTKGDKFSEDYHDFYVRPRKPGEAPKLFDIDYPWYQPRRSEQYTWTPDNSRLFGTRKPPPRPEGLDEQLNPPSPPDPGAGPEDSEK